MIFLVAPFSHVNVHMYMRVIGSFVPVQTGLTPLMEAASGGYYEVGKVLINKVRDVTYMYMYMYVSLISPSGRVHNYGGVFVIYRSL